MDQWEQQKQGLRAAFAWGLWAHLRATLPLPPLACLQGMQRFPGPGFSLGTAGPHSAPHPPHPRLSFLAFLCLLLSSAQVPLCPCRSSFAPPLPRRPLGAPAPFSVSPAPSCWLCWSHLLLCCPGSPAWQLVAPCLSPKEQALEGIPSESATLRPRGPERQLGEGWGQK